MFSYMLYNSQTCQNQQYFTAKHQCVVCFETQRAPGDAGEALPGQTGSCTACKWVASCQPLGYGRRPGCPMHLRQHQVVSDLELGFLYTWFICIDMLTQKTKGSHCVAQITSIQSSTQCCHVSMRRQHMAAVVVTCYVLPCLSCGWRCVAYRGVATCPRLAVQLPSGPPSSLGS